MAIGTAAAIGIGLSVAQMGMGLMQASGAAGRANAQSRQQQELVLRNFHRAQAEGTRQQERVNEVATDAKSDRRREGDRTIAALDVVAGERGLSGTTHARMTVAASYAEGLDLSRIEDNRENDIDGIQAAKAQGALLAEGQIQSIKNAEDNAIASINNMALKSIFDGIGGGLQIYGKDYYRQAKETRSKNIITSQRRA